MEFKEIESKWQKKWEDAKIGVPERNENKPKFFLIWAYATVSGFQHTGHMRGYSYADAIARFKRMTGHNVLLCAGGHATGNGAIAKANKLAKKDAAMVEELKSRGVTDEQIEKMSDVDEFINFFAKNYVKDYQSFGFVGDWQRFMLTTTPDYNKFIEWQFKKLNEKELIIQKPYFANCCVVDGPVAVDPSEMDLSKGGTAEQTDCTLIKLDYGKEQGISQYIVVATLRPETMYGQTNVWLDYDIEYVKIKIKPNNGKEEIWIASSEFADKIKYQIDEVKVIGKIKGSELTGNYCYAPSVDREIIILPSKFCDPNIGTGIVTSVPSDAPADYIGLHDLQVSEELCKKYNLDFEAIKNIKPIPIIKSKGYGDFPAIEICNRLGIKSQADKEKLEEAKKEIYKIGFHTGVMHDNAGPFAGMKVTEAKDKMKEHLIQLGHADKFIDLSEEVVCRCGNPVRVMRRDNAWFIKYSDEEWTQKSIKYLDEMELYPDAMKENFSSAVDWFSDRACAREGNWLGTKLPFDKNYTVEAISDSTLYPIYYMVSKYVNEGLIKPEQLTEEFFDYVFLERGTKEEVANKTELDVQLVDKVQKDVAYWYPLDINLGGKEHRTVHFPPFLLNHTALLPKKFWPKGIFVNFWVMQAPNQKLSKSKGGAQPIPGVSEKYSVDGMRLYYANAASPFADIYFEEESLLNYKAKIEKLNSFVDEILSKELSSSQGKMDAWFESSFNSSLKRAKDAMEINDFKTTSNEIYFNMNKLFTTYFAREGNNKSLVQEYLPKWIQTMGLFTPHIAEELNEKVNKFFENKETLVANTSWPKVKEDKINKEIEVSIELIGEIKKDIKDILVLAKIESPNEIKIIISPTWKYDFFKLFKEILEETQNPKDIISKVMTTNLKQYSKDVMRLIPACLKDRSKIPFVLLGDKKEEELVNSFKEDIEQEFKCKVIVTTAKDFDHPKSGNASPGKPAILVE
ncbi:leucine--tRNA ligase [Candidatus Woesearchaeota archaeon]|nr:leucine--tRNA ligase [Candidatus Woesearchaeota archaeon]